MLEYSEFIPNLHKSEDALEELLEDENSSDIFYHLEDAAITGVWIEGGTRNEIVVNQTAVSDQLSIEGYSVSMHGKAKSHFGASHVSTLPISLDAQYGMINGLEPEDYQKGVEWEQIQDL